MYLVTGLPQGGEGGGVSEIGVGGDPSPPPSHLPL